MFRIGLGAILSCWHFKLFRARQVEDRKVPCDVTSPSLKAGIQNVYMWGRGEGGDPHVLPMRGYQCLSFWIEVQHTYRISPELLMKPKSTVFVLTINVTCPIMFISLAICTLPLKFLCLLDSLALQECYDKAVPAHDSDSWECAYITLEASGCLVLHLV